MKTFVSSKNIYTSTILWVIVFSLIVILFIPKKETGASLYIGYAIIFLSIGFLTWVLFDTRYIIKENKLYYYSGPFRGKIEIDKIRKIKNHSGWIVPVTMKPSLDFNGLIVYYNQFDDIYISPKEKKEFIEALLRIKPNIEII